MKLPEPEFYSKLEDRMRHRKSNEWDACKAALLDWNKYWTGGTGNQYLWWTARTAMWGPVSFPILLQWDSTHPALHMLKDMHLGNFHSMCCLLYMVDALTGTSIEVYTGQSFKSAEILAAFPYWYICNRTFQVLPAWLPPKGQENQKINYR